MDSLFWEDEVAEATDKQVADQLVDRPHPPNTTIDACMFGQCIGKASTADDRSSSYVAAGEPDADRYGGIVFNSIGQVLLIEPKGHFDDYFWTFPKSRLHSGEIPEAAARRAVIEETGVIPAIFKPLSGVFGGTATGSIGRYFVMFDSKSPRRPIGSKYVERTAWATVTEAAALVARTRNPQGRTRDAAILRAAACAVTFWLSMSKEDNLWVDWFRLDRPWGMNDGKPVTRAKLDAIARAAALSDGLPAPTVQHPRRPRPVPPPTRHWTKWDLSQLRKGRLDNRGLAFVEDDTLCLNRSASGRSVFEAKLGAGPLGWVVETLVVDEATFTDSIGTDLWATTVFEHVVANLLLKKLDEALWRRFLSMNPRSI